MMNKEEYYKNRCIQLDKKLDRVIDSHTKLENKINDLQQRIDDAKDVVKEIKLHYQQHPTMIPSVKIDRLDEILGGKE